MLPQKSPNTAQYDFYYVGHNSFSFMHEMILHGSEFQLGQKSVYSHIALTFNALNNLAGATCKRSQGTLVYVVLTSTKIHSKYIS